MKAPRQTQEKAKPDSPANSSPSAIGQIQRKPASQAEQQEVPPIVHKVLNSPGQPLDKETREFFEPQFGHDFSQVRVHTDKKAGESARAVNALAYTVGENVVFDEGQYCPRTSKGNWLIAHELMSSSKKVLLHMESSQWIK